LANIVTAALFVVALFFTPIYAVVPSAAATPALVAVGVLLLVTQIKDIDWADLGIGIPAFLTLTLMPFTYSITNGIGAGVISYVVLNATNRSRRPGLLLWLTALLFAAYFALNPIEQALGIS
jgi:AGZA family xanthine/uracil permease-like MFS transporter